MRAKLPDECIAFEVISTPYYLTFPVGSIIEFQGVSGNYILCFDDEQPTISGYFLSDELRPLTPSARAALALVTP